MKCEIRRLKFLVPEMDDENVCPACSKVYYSVLILIIVTYSTDRIEQWNKSDFS